MAADRRRRESAHWTARRGKFQRVAAAWVRSLAGFAFGMPVSFKQRGIDHRRRADGQKCRGVRSDEIHGRATRLVRKIEAVTTRTYKRPAAALAARFEPSDQFLGTILPTKLRPRWAILNSKELWLGWLDSPAAIDFFAKELAVHRPLEILRHDLQADMALRTKLWPPISEGFSASVPPARISNFAKDLIGWSADAAFGIVKGTASGQDEAIENPPPRSAGRFIFSREATPRAGRPVPRSAPFCPAWQARSKRRISSPVPEAAWGSCRPCLRGHRRFAESPSCRSGKASEYR